MPRLFENKALKMASTYWENQDGIHVSDTLKKVVPFTKAAEVTDSDSIIKFEDIKVNSGDPGHLYNIIIGSFVNSENANFAAKQYQSYGYKTSIIRTTNHNGNKIELVSVKSFNNFNNAVEYLREFKSKVKSDAWIYPNK